MRKTHVKMLLATMLCAMLLFLAACGGGGGTTHLNISTSTSGGTFYVVGTKIADMINNNLDGIQATAEVTAGGVENVRLIASNETDIAFMPGDSLFNGTRGLGEFEEDGPTEMLVLAGLTDSPMQIVTLASTGITSVAELAGKRISIGAPGSSTAVRAELILKAHGLSLDDVQVDTTTSGEASTLLNDGMIDAAFFAASAPSSAVMDVAAKSQIVLLPITDEAMASMTTEQPYLHAYTIPAETYPGVSTDTVCISHLASLVASPNLSDDMAYQITKLLFDQIDDFKTAHSTVAAEFNIDTAAAQGDLAPYHPGAIKYYQEAGVM